MKGSGVRVAVAVAVAASIAAVALALSTVAAASGRKPSAGTRRGAHIVISFSGSGKGRYAWSVPEDDVGDDPGTCTAASNAYSTQDDFTFGWSERFSYPDGIGSYVLSKDYKVGGQDVTVQQQGSCTNGFGSPVGGDSFNCTTPFTALDSGNTDYPVIDVGGNAKRLNVHIHGGMDDGAAPTGTGTNGCAGQDLAQSYRSYAYADLVGTFTFSPAELARKGALTRPVHASFSDSCSGLTCDHGTCRNDQSPADVPTTCTDAQSYTGEIKVTYLR